MIEFSQYRFFWVPPLGFLIVILSFFLGGIDKIAAAYGIGLGMCLFVIGMMMIAFLNRGDAAVTLSSKILVSGFSIFFFSKLFAFTLNKGGGALDALSVFGGIVFFVGVLMGSLKYMRQMDD